MQRTGRIKFQSIEILSGIVVMVDFRLIKSNIHVSVLCGGVYFRDKIVFGFTLYFHTLKFLISPDSYFQHSNALLPFTCQIFRHMSLF